MQIDLVVLLGVISTVLGIIGTTYKLKKDENQTVKESTTEQIALSTKLDYLIKSVDDIKLDFRNQDTKIQSVAERVSRIEESIKNTIHRLDNLET